MPLYLSQALAVAMYIFPGHPALLVDLTTFVMVFSIAFVSAGLAFRIQHVVMAVIAASLITILANVSVWTSDTPLDSGDENVLA